MKNFTNLILYSDYSINIGYGTIDEYINVCKEKNINTLALTDVNSMMGIFRFLNKCKANNIKSIIGVTLEIDKNNVTLLAKNLQGYHELCRILMLSTKNNYEEPFLRIDDIKETNNIVAILHTFEKNVSEEFINQIKLKIHDTYLEYTLLLGNRQHIRQNVVRLSESTNTPFVLCNPTFYSTQDDFDMCEMNMALSHNYQMSETPITRGGLRPALYSNEHYLKSTDEVVDYIEKNYQDVKKEIVDLAFENNSKIVDSIEQVELEYQLGLRPIPIIPAPYTDNLSYFKALIQEGWNKIVVGKPKQIQLEWKRRIQNELEVIHSNDFIDYFLVVREYIKWSEDNGYPTGTGRGSCGGSCIARLLDIHKTDPVRYDLMFDRFLSPGRSAIARITYNDNSFEEVPVSTIKNINSKDNYTYTIHVGDTVDNKVITNYKIVDIGAAPDVDTDFIPNARSLVFKHCQEVYGENNITHIITRMPYKPRNAFKAICRISGVSPQEANAISESLPDSTSKDTLLNVLDEKNDEYKGVRLQLNGKLLDLMKKASRLEGRTSGTGVHACGVLISSKEICDVVPTAYKKNPHQDEDENEIFVKDENEVYQVSMFEYPEAESLGLIKMDFLGLDTLSLINDTVKLIKKYMNEDVNMQDIIDGNLDDADTYKIFQKGETNGIFQFTEQGVQEMLKKVQPSEFEELPAITAIYRPGPMSLGLHDDFAIRKHDESKRIPFSKEFVNTPIDELTKNTFGAIVYQEQVMKIAQEAAGFTSKEADKMRKAMGKKKVEILNMLEPKFKDGIIKKTHCLPKTIDEFWSQLLGFAQYGFNKCLDSRTRVYLPDSSSITVKDLYEQFNQDKDKELFILSMFEDGSVRPHKVKNVVKTGYKPCYKIKTKSGKRIIITKDHRMLTNKGYGTIADGTLTVGTELIEDVVKNRISDTTRKIRSETITRLNKNISDERRKELSDKMKAYQSTLTFEDRSKHQQQIQKDNPHRTDNWFKAAQEKNCEFWATDSPEREARIEKYRQTLYTRRDENGNIFGIKTTMSNGEVADSILEACVGEYLINRNIDFEFHKNLPGTLKYCDFYVDGLYIEVDGLNRGTQYFKEHKYGDELPFIVVAPHDYIEKLDEALTTQHVGNGDEIVEILSQEEFGHGIHKTQLTFDIEMELDGPSNFIANGFVSHNSHAVSYALNSYQSAYLKVHYPVMWSTAALRMYANNNKKFPKYVADVEAMGIKVLPPNINESDLLISPTSDLNGVTYSISNIKSISTAVLESFVLERHKNGQYKDITDFINRNRDNLTATTLKALACSGCLDCFGNTRKSIYENAEALIKGSNKKKSNVISMFSMVDDVDDVGVKLDNREWPISIKMANEGKALGTYLSGNPLDGLKSQDGQEIIQTKHLKNCDTTQYITFLDVSQKKTKSGNTVIIGTADNKASRMEIRLPSKITDRIMLGIALDKSNGDRNEAYRIMKLSSDKIAQFNKLEPLEKPVKFKQIYKLTYKKAYKGRVMIDNIEPVIVSENNQILQEIIVPKNKTQNLNQFMKLLEQETKQANLSNMKLTDILIKYYSEKEQDWKTREINQVYVSPSSIRLIQ